MKDWPNPNQTEPKALAVWALRSSMKDSRLESCEHWNKEDICKFLNSVLFCILTTQESTSTAGPPLHRHIRPNLQRSMFHQMQLLSKHYFLICTNNMCLKRKFSLSQKHRWKYICQTIPYDIWPNMDLLLVFQSLKQLQWNTTPLSKKSAFYLLIMSQLSQPSCSPSEFAPFSRSLFFPDV